VLAPELDGEQRQFVEHIEKSARRLLATFCAVLDLAQLEGGNRLLATERIDLIARTREIVGGYEQAAEMKGMRIRTELADHALWAMLDDRAFATALGHIIDNAIKFSAGGEVLVGVRTEGSGVVCTVSDAGAGMGEAFVTRAYDAFSQESRGVSRTYEGCGLGLTVARGLIELMGGQIQIESAVGRGTVVEMKLPAAQAT
jgi:signal transduction histidine kinase